MLLLCGDMIPPGVGWLLRCAPTPRILAVLGTQLPTAAGWCRMR
jgi:hypothetical protein